MLWVLAGSDEAADMLCFTPATLRFALHLRTRLPLGNVDQHGMCCCPCANMLLSLCRAVIKDFTQKYLGASTQQAQALIRVRLRFSFMLMPFLSATLPYSSAAHCCPPYCVDQCSCISRPLSQHVAISRLTCFAALQTAKKNGEKLGCVPATAPNNALGAFSAVH